MVDVDVVVLRLGQEADVAEVDPEQRGPAVVGELGGAQDRAVAADHHDQLAVGARRRPRRAELDVGSIVGAAPRAAASSASSRTAMPCPVSASTSWRGHVAGLAPGPVCASSEHAARGRSRLVTVHLLTRHPRADRPTPPRRSRSASTAAGPRRSHRKNSTLPDGPGQRAGGHRPGAPARGAAAASATVATASARSAGVAHDAALADPVLADLELRLHHQHQVAVRRAVTPISASSTSVERDERQVADHEVDRAADGREVELADVGAVVHDDPLVLPQPPGQLAVPDVDRHHLARRRAAAARR